MTVVLHSFHDRRDILVAIMPINEETGSLIAEVFLTLRDKIYSKGSFLVFGGGDGTSMPGTSSTSARLEMKTPNCRILRRRATCLSSAAATTMSTTRMA